MKREIHLGISTCPNDTFAFHALLERAIDLGGLELRIELCDVQELNERLLAGEFDLAKASFAAALELSADCVVLPAGSALGFGVGPLLLARPGLEQPERALNGQAERPLRVLCPGRHTTGTLLYRLFHPAAVQPEQAHFAEIMPALECGQADLGVCIHEGRFTWRERGLQRVEDLGRLWEERTERALPLGGILARRSLGSALLARLSRLVRDSIDYAHAHRAQTLPSLRRHARELTDEVLWAHVDLYVNDSTRELGSEGRSALETLGRLARDARLCDGARQKLEVFERPAQRLFHVLGEAQWRAHLASAEGAWCPPSLTTEGFLHLSFRQQLEGTLATHFKGRRELLLLEIDPERAGPELRLEVSREGQAFPHLYAGLPADWVVGEWKLDPGQPTPRLPAALGD